MDPEQIPLRDLHLPEADRLVAAGAGLVGADCACGSGSRLPAYKRISKWRWNAARRLRLRELGRIRREYEDGADAQTGSELSELLRRTMLAYAPRGEVAGLTGESWLAWLDQGLDDKPFH